MVFLMLKNSTIITDLRYADKNLPLAQIYIDQNINDLQFVRIKNKGFHFVTFANILEMRGLSFMGLISSFDLFTWIALLVISIFSTFVLIRLLKHSSITYSIYDTF